MAACRKPKQERRQSLSRAYTSDWRQWRHVTEAHAWIVQKIGKKTDVDKLGVAGALVEHRSRAAVRRCKEMEKKPDADRAPGGW
jgi:hypothetical protein